MDAKERALRLCERMRYAVRAAGRVDGVADLHRVFSRNHPLPIEERMRWFAGVRTERNNDAIEEYEQLRAKINEELQLLGSTVAPALIQLPNVILGENRYRLVDAVTACLQLAIEWHQRDFGYWAALSVPQTFEEMQQLLEQINTSEQEYPISAKDAQALLVEIQHFSECIDALVGSQEKSRPSKPKPPWMNKSIEEIERETPPLDTKSVEWVRAEQKNKEFLGLPIKTLRDYRLKSKGGRISPNEMFGIDRYGRIWRREGTPNSRIWYYAPSLPKSVE
ncbi:MAG: hypothetical protein KatS3mg111_0389 [Pirellulaceae bacterium]|nr:MAG: hypothetical protein KatS3mg111_0389 [Pirellulaceae bacterium]